jgi:hypothetical protein
LIIDYESLAKIKEFLHKNLDKEFIGMNEDLSTLSEQAISQMIEYWKEQITNKKQILC